MGQLAQRAANSDIELIELWLHGRSIHTQRLYSRGAGLLLRFCQRPLASIALGDLQAYAQSLQARGLADGSRRTNLAAVKSLFAFAHRIGYLPLDTGRPLRLPSAKDTLAERILSREQIRRLIASELDPRNKTILRVLHTGGIRASELVGLSWRDCIDRTSGGGGGQLTVFGKGQKTRVVLLERPTWLAMLSLRTTDTAADDPVFASRKKNGRVARMGASHIRRIVKAAAKRAGLDPRISTHWLRHCCASHALDAGCKISVVQQRLGHANVATTSRYLHIRPDEGTAKFLDDDFSEALAPPPA